MNSLWVILILNEFESVGLYISIDIVCTQLNGFKYCWIALIIQFNISYLLAHSEVVLSIAHINSYICTQLNGFKYFYSTQRINLYTVKKISSTSI